MTEPTPRDIQLLSDRTYDILQFLSTVFLPALGTAYFTIGELWGAPYVAQVVGTITAIALLVGALIKASVPSHRVAQQMAHKLEVKERTMGEVVVNTDEDGLKQMVVEFDEDPYDLDKHEEVTFRVVTR